MKAPLSNYLKHDMCGSLLLAAVIFIIFTWPLVLKLKSAIPYGATDETATVTQRMWPGDHLQLMYNFWLFEDMAGGNTPWFHNLYEFNTGDDAARREVQSYFAPFSLFFAAGDWVAGRAFGWNFALFMSVWMMAFFCARLARHYTDVESVVWLAALAASVLPYRWMTVLGGSPTGFAMAWVPLVFLGLSRAMRDFDTRAAWVAGGGMLLCALGDIHCVFFAVLAVPCWCLVVLILRADARWRFPPFYLKSASMLVPLGMLTAVGMLTLRGVSKDVNASNMAEGGRTLKEISIFCPHVHDLFYKHGQGAAIQVYAGYGLMLLLVFAAVSFLKNALKSPKENGRRLLAFGLVVLGGVLIFALALGVNSFHGGILFRAARKLIPHYSMIRQPTKILVLLPPLLTVFVAMAAGEIRAWMPNARAFALLVLFFGLAIPLEFHGRAQPMLTTLDADEAGYRAVADDAQKESADARALVIPLWPGDTHYSAVYQYYASLYRIRLVNGYRPVVSSNYLNEVFHRFETANLGWLDNAQLDRLQEMNVSHLIFQENIFPEKVSPFQPPATLKNLMANPRLELIAGDTPAKTFRILAKPSQHVALYPALPFTFPARRFQAEKCQLKSAEIVNDDSVSSRQFVRLSSPLTSRVLTPPIEFVPRDQFRWAARMKGEGEARCDVLVNGLPRIGKNMALNSKDWKWYEIPYGGMEVEASNQLSVASVSGVVDVDVITCLAGPSPLPPPGGTVVIPAACFSHAGRTVMDDNSVELSPELDFAWTALFGPKWPWEPGHWRMVMHFESDAPAGTDLGVWRIEAPEDIKLAKIHVVAGKEAAQEINLPTNLTMTMVFIYSGNGKIRIKDITITRR